MICGTIIYVMAKKTFQIAIDGPVAAGKGTTAKLVAQRLGFLYVDTGALYRALTLYVQRKGVSWEDEREVVRVLLEEKPKVGLRVPSEEEKDGRLCTVLLNGEDVSWKVRTEEVSRGVSVITQYAGVRDLITPLARQIAEKQDVVMEGRDITSVVLPDADLLIYMDADPRERAKRRHRELLMRGEDISLEQVYKDLMERDKRDSGRAIAPLTKVAKAWRLDTTGMTIDQVAEAIVAKVKTV
ncbi:MAG: Cytidylate kinase [Microgenomates group bacterium GW2011_GWC1_46_16]|nr:MAG: Cytidylate kinase [Microgenomates group bacterium GW2011_GWF1_46_12]KKU27102.1 MAG: Cytidylate kinase [Microgenomates group bacterium GW2011_GWC1_46_16]KKU27856.1 MAG: Cytidylate kinase [Microgenomates group bacterium GW2011_GWF2_46_18]KKU42984.1 MAG: Cytidylate kinase [Microgenomates group bacterium GW2011_GWA1_46_7]KKU45072.1 MAG: Cytidylate kinase [Microgenomates group bacterium GW2011_GWB1_46_7]KKU60843.1 MAG: Cytidylate kinase [Microgenomates group bacterium GW2011_GWE1_47_12]KKU